MFMRPAIAGILTLTMLAACKSKDEYAAGSLDTSKPVSSFDSAAASAATPATPATNVSSDKWSSPNVLGYAMAANAGEVALGKLAEKKATAANVKAFAKMMVADHSAMLAETKKLGSKLSVMADTAADAARDLTNHGHDALKELTDKAASADWDKNYIDKMVDGHKDVLDKLQDAAKNTPDAQVKAALEKAVGKVQTHLTKAQDIQSKMK
jgi:putative membrane protein